MLELSISLLILICSALAIYCIQTLFSKFPEYKKRIKRPEDIEIIPLLTDKVVVLSKEKEAEEIENKKKNKTKLRKKRDSLVVAKERKERNKGKKKEKAPSSIKIEIID